MPVSASLASPSWSAAAAAVLVRLSTSGMLLIMLEDEEQSSGGDGACMGVEAGPPALAGVNGPDWRRAIASSSGVRRLLPLDVVVVGGAILTMTCSTVIENEHERN